MSRTEPDTFMPPAAAPSDPPLEPPMLVLPRGERLIALFFAGLIAFNPPLLRVFGIDATVFGWPLLYIYLFAAWAGLIALVALIVERRAVAEERHDEHG